MGVINPNVQSCNNCFLFRQKTLLSNPQLPIFLFSSHSCFISTSNLVLALFSGSHALKLCRRRERRNEASLVFNANFNWAGSLFLTHPLSQPCYWNLPSFLSLAQYWKSRESLVSFLTWAWHNQKRTRIFRTNRLCFAYFKSIVHSTFSVHDIHPPYI